MQATDELKKEHHAIELMLKILKAVSAKLEQGEQILADHLNGIMAFLTVFVDKCHHGKEEEFLFPALEAAGGLSLAEIREGKRPATSPSAVSGGSPALIIQMWKTTISCGLYP